MRNKFTTTLLVLLATIILVNAAPVFACGGCAGRGSGITLTDAQREIVRTAKIEMINADATCEEMRNTIGELLTSYDITLPESCGTRMECGRRTAPCEHAPGECDSSCVKPGGHSRSGDHSGGCHNRSDGCHGSLPDGDAYFSSINNNNPSPGQVSMTKIMPNPYNATTEIRIGGDIGNGHFLDIYDVEGHIVRAIPINSNIVIWDGIDSNGQNVNTGTYFGRIRGTNVSQKIILIK